MKSMYFLSSFMLAFIFITKSIAQDHSAPSWFTEPPHGTYAGFGEDSNLETALQRAEENAQNDVIKRGQYSIDSKGRVIDGDTQIGKVRVLKKEYQKISSYYRAYILISIDIDNNLTNPFLSSTYSTMLPGGGQVYKRDYAKSVMFLLGTAGLVSGAFVMDNKADDAYRISKSNSSFEDKRNNQQLGDDYVLARDIFIGAAGILYLYNIFDAAFSDHHPRYDLSFNYNKDNIQLNFALDF